MRFEAKHDYFKVLANNLGNYNNLPKTMVSRHQHLMCYYLANNKEFSNFYCDGTVTTAKGNFMHESTHCSSTACMHHILFMKVFTACIYTVTN